MGYAIGIEATILQADGAPGGSGPSNLGMALQMVRRVRIPVSLDWAIFTVFMGMVGLTLDDPIAKESNRTHKDERREDVFP